MARRSNATIRGVIKETEESLRTWESKRGQALILEEEKKKEHQASVNRMMYYDIQILAVKASLVVYNANLKEEPMWKKIPLLEEINQRRDSWETMIKKGDGRKLHIELGEIRELYNQIIIK